MVPLVFVGAFQVRASEPSEAVTARPDGAPDSAIGLLVTVVDAPIPVPVIGETRKA